MPSYNGVTANLCMWDPCQPPQKDVPPHTMRHIPADAAYQYNAQPLMEEHFEGLKGVQFLGDAATPNQTPFVLVNTGRDVFYKTRQPAWKDRYDELIPAKAPKQHIAKPITSPKPIKIRISGDGKRLHTKGPHTNQPQELCIDIFYNGELVHSKVFNGRSGAAAAETDHDFCGRRIDTNLEVPWVILPIVDEQPEKSGFEERWNKVNELLVKYADKWGKTGLRNMFRAPVGEYLESLSKMPVPQRKEQFGTVGANSGIVDVIVSMGRTVYVPNYLCVSKPTLHLPEDTVGKDRKLYSVPEELRPAEKDEIFADFVREEEVKAVADRLIKNPKLFAKQDSADNYLALRNRKLPMLPSSPMSSSMQSRIQNEATAPGLGFSSDMDNTPSKPPNRRNRNVQSGGADPNSMDRVFWTDGSGHIRKRKAHSSKAQGQSPVPEMYQSMLAEADTGPEFADRTLKRRKKVSGFAPTAEGQSTTALKSSAEANKSNGPSVKEQSEKPRYRSRAVSERELGAVLKPHKPNIALNTSFGDPSSDKSSNRPRRNDAKKLKEAVIEPQCVQEKSAQVKATYDKPMLTIKGYASPVLTSSHTRSPIPIGTETERTTLQLPEIQPAAETSVLAPTLSEAADLEWKPNDPLGAKSVLTYATAETAAAWPKSQYVPHGDLYLRYTKMEKEAVFRASSVLMGFRFVLGLGHDEC